MNEMAYHFGMFAGVIGISFAFSKWLIQSYLDKNRELDNERRQTIQSSITDLKKTAENLGMDVANLRSKLTSIEKIFVEVGFKIKTNHETLTKFELNFNTFLKEVEKRVCDVERTVVTQLGRDIYRVGKKSNGDDND